MSVDSAVFDALKGLVPDNRAYADVLEQPNGELPPWPSIRYSIVSSEPAEDICGTGTDDTDDIRVQVDSITKTSAERVILRQAVRAAMQGISIPTRFEGVRNEYDPETKTYRSSQDFILYQSTPAQAVTNYLLVNVAERLLANGNAEYLLTV